MKKILFILLLLFAVAFSQAQVVDGAYRLEARLGDMCASEVAYTTFWIELEQDGEKITGSVIRDKSVDGFLLSDSNFEVSQENINRFADALEIRGWVDPSEVIHLNFFIKNVSEFFNNETLQRRRDSMFSGRLFEHISSSDYEAFHGDFDMSFGTFETLFRTGVADMSYVRQLGEKCTYFFNSPKGSFFLSRSLN